MLEQYNIGMTGTRNEPTPEQKFVFEEYLSDIFYHLKTGNNEIIFRDGDCVGSDAYCGAYAKLTGCISHIHPPEKNDLRAFRECDVMYEPKSYFARNRDIVNASDMMFVIMKDFDLNATIGGTIYTYNYAQKQKKPIIVIFPDGDIRIFGEDVNFYNMLHEIWGNK